jgi:hypothetical protein
MLSQKLAMHHLLDLILEPCRQGSHAIDRSEQPLALSLGLSSEFLLLGYFDFES